MDEILSTVESVVLCAQHMRRIVDDILTLSKLDGNLLAISPDKMQPPSLVTRALKMFEAEIELAGIDAKLCVEPSLEQLQVDWVLLDSSRVLQIIINLLTNSIKFTQYCEVRSITITVGASLDKPTGSHHGLEFVPTRLARPPHAAQPDWGEGEDVYVQIAVTDTGCGLSELQRTRLFQRFQQADTKTYKQYGGSGLGLWISRELCELQGGQIGVASEHGETTFAFYVRAKRWLARGSESTRLTELHRSTSNSSMASGRRGSVMIEKLTLAKFDKLASGHGVTDPTNGTPLDTLTVPGVTKPVQVNGSHPATDELHVLVVEDNVINAKILSQQLRKAGCTVHLAGHGQEALSFLERTTFHGAETPLSVVLLDLEMPVMDGWTCIKHIRERQTSGAIVQHVPVIAVTANARMEQISVAIEAGMDSVVTKPFRIPELMPQMQRLVAETAQRQNGLP